MKICLILSLCVIAFTSCSNENASNSNGYISAGVSLYNPTNIVDYIKKNKISNELALSSIDSLQKSFKSSYVGYNLKKALINKSGDEIFNECKNNLNQNSNGLSSFEFYDYVLQCIADFKDSHIRLSKMITPSFVSTGVAQSRMIDKKLYITSIRPNLIKKIEELQKLPDGSLSAKLKVGTEIVSIDGNDPQTEINKLKKFVSASSDLALQNEATEGLFRRTFAYPAKIDVSLALKLADLSIVEVNLPWVQILTSSNPGSIESRTLLNDRGIIKSSDLNPDNKFASPKGVDFSGPLFSNLANSRTYQDADAYDVLLTGVTSIKNKNYCYMQLNTFNFDPDSEFGFKIFEKIANKNYPLSLSEVLKNYLQSCAAFQAPLIFDLRNNGGGNTKVAEMIYAMLETNKTKTTYTAKANLSEIGNFSVINGTLDTIDSNSATLVNLLTFQSMKEALDTNSSITSWVLTKNIKLVSDLYSGDIFVLTSPDCVSACESTVNRFKKSRRAKIIGENTNGTGFGFSSNNLGKTNFRDSLNLIEVKIPNHAFQSALVEDDSDFKVMNDVKGSLFAFDKINVLENNPTTPDVEIKYTLNDLINNYSDYLDNLSKVLSSAYSLY